MTAPPRQTLDWLYRVLAPVYADADRAYADSVRVLTDYPTLKVKTDVYTAETGQSELLLCLYGTIPAVVGGSTYRIPVKFWLPRQYPQVGPLAYVQPTDTMLIHPSNHVDANGKCYHPYLSYWSLQQTFSELIAILSDVFGKQPPVYSKPPAYQQQSTTTVRSPPPAVPIDSHPNNPVNMAPAVASNQGHVALASPTTSANTPPLPPKPPRPPTFESQLHPQSPTYTQQTPAYQSPPPPIQQHHAHYVPQQQTAAQPQTLAQPHPHTAYYQHPPPAQLDQMNSRYASQQYRQPNGTPRQPVDIMDDISTPTVGQGPAPQRPPNPEKLQALERLDKAFDESVALVNKEKDSDEKHTEYFENLVEWADKQLDREIDNLERLGAACTENERILDEKIEQANNVIRDAEARPQPNIDDVVSAENAVYNQLYDLVSDDHAIDDTIYALGKLLDHHKIQLEPYMRHTRALAREQFLKRALINKISQEIGI